MIDIPGYHVHEQLYESHNSQIYRAHRDSDHQSVILKVLKKNYPTPTERNRYKREYDILHALDLPGIIKAYDLREHQHTLVLILEDFDGESLQNLMKIRRFTVEECLIVAIQISRILGEIHAAHVIHKNIHPSNILWSPESGSLKLIDFSMATVLLRESPALAYQDVLEENLAYMSPEQTGRMNRAVDYRTDFYSFGVTLYRLIAESLPFETTDAMELVHCHIAKHPVAPCKIRSEIPKIVSDIILKLLAKTAEERYQSAWGIQADFEECLKQLRATGVVSPFSLASQDIPDRFHLSQKLYGREHEIATLLTAFERVCAGNCEMMLVGGYAGIGKTSLVHEISQPVTEKRGYFISGKFDQLHHRIPYSAIIKAFQKLMRHLLGESEAALRHWREKLVTALESNGQVLVDVIPEVEWVIGPQAPVPELGPMESQNRFTLVFQNFVRVFCQKKHPLVLFLDDLQWIDSASLKLIASMMNDVDMHHFLFIGAYRENEVDAAHPLMRTLDTLRQESRVISQVTLSALQFEHITQFLADTLRCNREVLDPFAKLVIRKTDGNPFFINQFLTILHQEGLLTFNAKQRRWTWDLSQLNAVNITDNMVELMAGKLKKLPELTQRALRLAACIGNRFDVRILSIICEKSTADTGRDLFPAVQEELIVPLSGVEVSGRHSGDESFKVYEYTFLHDRVQQAAYELTEPDRRKATHLAIGRLLLRNLTPQEQNEQIFALVNQLNWGRELLSDGAERKTLAELNLSAGKKAKASTAYERASDYLELARTLLGDVSWKTQHDLTFAVYTQSAECEYLIGHFDRCSRLVHIALEHCESALEKGSIFLIRITLHSLQGHYREAFQLGIEALQILGVTLPDPQNQYGVDRFFHNEVQWYTQHWQGRQIMDLCDLEINEEPLANLTMSILAAIVDIASLMFPSFLGVVTIIMVNLSVKDGNTAMSPFGYLFYGIFQFGALKDYEAAYQFGKLSLKLNEEKIHNVIIQSRLLDMFGCCLSFLDNHLQKSIEILEHSYQAGWEFGDFVYAAYALTNKMRFSLSTGLNLSDAIEENENALHLLQKLNNASVSSLNQVYTGFALNLQGETLTPLSFDYGTFREEDFQQSFSQIPLIFTFYENYKLQSFYYLENYDRALSLVSQIDTTTKDILLEGEEFRFFAALTLLAVYSAATCDDKRRYAEHIAVYHAAIQKLAVKCPLNFRAHEQILSAERARVGGHVLDAIECYEGAIAAARESEFIHQEALANELAAKFWLERGNKKFAGLYMTEAYQCYQRWGATAKVNILQQHYPNLLPFPLAHAQTSPSTFDEHLDLRAVFKASQAISGEIHLGKLLATIMKIIVEHAGAEKGVFLLNADGKLTIEASVTADSDAVEVLHSLPVGQSRDVSTAIVNYVSRSAEHIVLHNATQEGAFTQDLYVLESHPKSILSMPVCYQDTIVGVLYLENNLTTHAFTEDRIAVLNVLVAQAAISLENAKLFEMSKRAEERLRNMNRELQEQNLFINTLIDISPDVIYIYDLVDTKNIFVNEGIQRNLGYSEHEIKELGASIIPHLMHPEDLTRYRQQIFPKYADLHDGEIFEHEYRMQHKDGAWRWLGSKELIFKRLPDGSPWQIFGMVSDITDRKRTEERLKTSLAEKEVLLRELYHRTKNTLHVIRSMLILQAARMPEDAQVQKLVNDMERRIMAMALVHQKLYQSQDLSRISMRDYIGELAHLIIKSHVSADRNISLRLEVDDLSLLLDTAIPCGLILTELLSNALKYAFPDGHQGEIAIRLRRNNPEHVELCVADNGIGVPAGVDLRGQETLGIQTIVAIAEHQMQGQVQFASEQGLTCTINFPDALYRERV